METTEYWKEFLNSQVKAIINDPPSDIPKKKEGFCVAITATHLILKIDGRDEAILLSLVRRIESIKKEENKMGNETESLQMAKRIVAELNSENFSQNSGTNRDIVNLASWLHMGNNKMGMAGCMRRAKKLLAEENLSANIYSDIINFAGSLYLK